MPPAVINPVFSQKPGVNVGSEVTAVTITDLTPGLIYDISLVALSRYLPSPVVAYTVPLGEPSIPALVVCLTGR